MCLAVPMRVRGVQDGQAEVEVGGVRSRVSLALIDEPAIGDYLIVHAGYAISVLDIGEAEKSLALFEEVARRLGQDADALHSSLS